VKLELESGSGSILRREDLNRFLNLLQGSNDLYGPTRVQGRHEIRRITAPEQLDTRYANLAMSPKSLFLPQTETLFTFATGNRKTSPAAARAGSGRNILFGVRPCDAMAITFLDRIFSGEDYRDPRYAARRASLIVITLACTVPDPTCFCTTVDCAPDSEIGADVILFELPAYYLVKPVTRAGRDVLEAAASLLTGATRNDWDEKHRSAQNARQSLRHGFDPNRLTAKLGDFQAPYWEKLHRECLGCGVCTYLCPTCYCFDITDETIKSRGRRIRTWDSCMFPRFTQHASGHNPRPTQKERTRQRILHKFNYALKSHGRKLCVGCGRCIAFCPVGIDIRSVLKEIVES